MKKVLLIALLGCFAGIGNSYGQTTKKTSSGEEKTEKKKESAEERDERRKEDMRRFGRSQADFWKKEHEKQVAKKEAKEGSGEDARVKKDTDSTKSEIKREGPPKPPPPHNPFKKKKKQENSEEE